MNQFVREHWEVFASTQGLRSQLLDILTDADLAFTPGGSAPTLGDLCCYSGEVEIIYTGSFKTGKADWTYRHEDPANTGSVDALRTWYAALDENLKTVIYGMSDEDLQKPVDRGGGFIIPAVIHAHIYREALLIFCGKVSVYLQAMGKPLPQQWQTWIG